MRQKMLPALIITLLALVANTHRLRQTLNELGDMDGVVSARRR